MQDSHVVDHPGPAHPRVTPRMLRSNRITHMTRVGRKLRNTVLAMALRRALELATGVATVRDIGVGREGYPYHVAYPNSSVEVRFPLNLDSADGILFFHHGDPGKEPRKGHDQSLRFNPCSRSLALQNLFLP